MLQIYVDALNSPEGIPEVSSTWDQVMTNTYQIATTKAIEVYKSKMSDLTFPMEDGDLKRIHQEATEKSVECFQQLTWLDTDGGVYSDHLSQLSVSVLYPETLYIFIFQHVTVSYQLLCSIHFHLTINELSIYYISTYYIGMCTHGAQY